MEIEAEILITFLLKDAKRIKKIFRSDKLTPNWKIMHV